MTLYKYHYTNLECFYSYETFQLFLQIDIGIPDLFYFFVLGQHFTIFLKKYHRQHYLFIFVYQNLLYYIFVLIFDINIYTN